MFLKKISLENFRNHPQAEYHFTQGITLFLGENGKGKTNIIEAIFALSSTRAFRSHKKEVFIEHQKDFGRVQGEITVGSSRGADLSRPHDNEITTEQLEIFWSVQPKKNIYKKNDIPISASEFIQQKKFLAVLFSPEDMNLPSTAPAERRKIFSRILSSLFPEYFDAALKYDVVLKNRNELLKKFSEGMVQKEEFFFWNSELIKYHTVLQKYRKKFFSEVNEKISEIYQKISGSDETVEVKFLPSIEEAQSFERKIQKNFERDIFLGRTTSGSHRDDFQFLLRGIPLQEGASRGETRSAILAFKMAEKIFIEKISTQKPLLLLDDVFSELDLCHQKKLMNFLQGYQVIITATHSEVVLDGDEVRVYEI